MVRESTRHYGIRGTHRGIRPSRSPNDRG
jgi:hypothetical protein